MIHKIHTGEALAQKPYLIYGFGPPPPAGTGYTVVDFADVRFPGQLRNCETCHLPGSYFMPPYPGTALSTRQTHLEPVPEPTPGSVQVEDPRIPPITAVCTSCHDDDAAVAHATTQTTDDGVEACTVCHDEGAPYPVSVSHRP
jgi:OmcA/MtrC family decaheme c-type cytochrome